MEAEKFICVKTILTDIADIYIKKMLILAFPLWLDQVIWDGAGGVL